MSITKVESDGKSVHKSNAKRKAIGMCIKCGHKITFCGKPFSAEIPCSKCLFINVFQESQQPVTGRW
jgi:hypothetical protein